MPQKLKLDFLAKPIWAISLIVLIVLILYIRVLGFGYVWDDNDIFFGTIDTLRNGQLTISGLSNPILGNQQYFRPLAVLTYYCDVSIAGLNPGFSHGVNLTLFIINALLIFSICQTMTEKSGRVNSVRLAFFASLLYIIHPAMTETTAWISGRFDLLATSFILGATRIYLGSARRYLKVTLVSLLTLLALLCKETGIMLPIALLCIWFSMNTTREENTKVLYLRALRENADFFLGFLIIFSIYFILRFYVNQDNYFNYTLRLNFGEKCFLFLEALKFYLHQTFLPFFTTSAIHPITQISPWSLSDILGNIMTLLIASFLIIHAFYKRSCSAWLFFTGLSYLILVLYIIPVPIGNNLGHERFLTTPLAFFVIAIVLIRYDLILSSARLTRFFSSMHTLSAQRIAWTLAMAWMLTASFTTFSTIPSWKNNLLLWGINYSLYPDDEQCRLNYLSAAYIARRYDLIEKTLDKVGTHNFSIKEQIFYAILLFTKNDPKSLDYFEGVIDAFQEPHTLEQPLSPEKIKNLRAHNNALTIAQAYTSYSAAVFVFRTDPEKALALNDTAIWYAKIVAHRNETSWIEVRNIAYLYAMGKFEKGDVMKLKIESVMGIDLTKRVTESLLGSYCRNAAVAENCERLRHKGLFRP